MTAYANDWGFERVFERQVQALGRPNDVLIAISTSGNSPNILAAVNAARALRMQTIALTGGAGRLAASADVVISVPSSHTQHIQEVHLAIEHIICELVEEAVASD
jgi:D-sedoheptulose 7-phosphate isomerase